ncbi:MAG: hypothetical protein ACJ8AW_51475 [Rhodopila sp.]
MSVREPLPQDAVDMVVASLLHLILPVLESEAAARALALRMLTEYQPESVRELHLAGEIIGFSLNGLKALGDCGAAAA